MKIFFLTILVSFSARASIDLHPEVLCPKGVKAYATVGSRSENLRGSPFYLKILNEVAFQGRPKSLSKSPYSDFSYTPEVGTVFMEAWKKSCENSLGTTTPLMIICAELNGELYVSEAVLF
jgi:hypothetical protein